MKLEKLVINGFRKLKEVTIELSDATFLIGENNVGKSSILKAIELLITKGSTNSKDISKIFNPDEGAINDIVDKIIIEGTFSNVAEEAESWLGFRGRVYIENGNRKIKYRKTFSNGSTIYEMWQQTKEIKEGLKNGSKVTIPSLIAGGLEEESVRSYFEGMSDTVNLTTKANNSKLEGFIEAWDFAEEFSWVNNPGGIPQNIISKLPKFILIPAEHKSNEIDSNKNTALGEVMTTIFDDIVQSSENFVKVKEYFSELESEIDTENVETEFGKLMLRVNSTIKSIFPDSEILAKINLSDPSTFLKPKYDIKLGSNIMTDVDYQGTGMIRSTAFSLLKFREDWKKERENDLRNLIIAFEEPELFLHPNAANQMRNTIYDLAGTDNQIICTSHSPYMIDLSRERENQIVNNLSIKDDTFVKAIPFSVTEKYRELLDDEKHYVKMLVKLDDYFARAFFAKKILILEGDTEDIVMRKTLSILPISVKNKILSDFQFIKARGKATIPPLIKYFRLLGITNIFVIHDRDQGVARAEDVNPRILDAIGFEENRVMLEECIEDTLGYPPPSANKPYKAFVMTKDWSDFDSMPDKWKEVIITVFTGYIDI